MSVRTIHRTLAMVASTPVLAAGVLAVAPAAHAAGVPGCDPALSTRLLAGEVLGQAELLYVQAVSPTETHVCYGTYPERLTVVVRSDLGVGLPQVGRTDGTGACAGGTELLDLTDPVALELSFAVTTAPTVCVGIGNVTTTLSFTGASVTAIPDVELWHDGNGSVLDAAICAQQYVAWVQAGGTQYGSAYNAWYACAYGPHQIV